MRNSEESPMRSVSRTTRRGRLAAATLAAVSLAGLAAIGIAGTAQAAAPQQTAAQQRVHAPAVAPRLSIGACVAAGGYMSGPYCVAPGYPYPYPVYPGYPAYPGYPGAGLGLGVGL
jgi:hypothetical protein